MKFCSKVLILASLTLVIFSLLNCSAEPKSKPKSLVETQQKVLENAKALEDQLKEAEAKRRKQMDGQ